MNTDTIVHPKLNHYGLITHDLDAMIDWYHKVLGMTVNHRSARSAGAAGGPPFTGLAFVSNDEVNHRIVFFEMPGPGTKTNGGRQGPLQHVAFACDSFDDLLGTYARLKGLGIEPVWAADHGVGTAIYYRDPDGNIVEISVSNYGSEWTATEHIKTAEPVVAHVDPGKMLAARKEGASDWDLHRCALAGNFAPDTPFNPRSQF
jgi:catechol-2,3-dioxygenase